MGRIFLFVVGLVLLAERPARASVELREVLREAATELQKLLGKESQDSVAVGQFTGPANFPTAAGPGFVQTLTEELKKLEISVKTRAKFGIKGEYRLAEMPAENPDDARIGVKVLGLRLRLVLEDEFGNPRGEFNFDRLIRGEATLLTAIGLPAALPPGDTERERDRKMRQRVIDPKTNIKGTIVRSDPASPYAIEILVNDAPRETEDKEGLAFVPIRRGEVYAVRLINDSPHDAAVQLKIDGLSMFTFSEMRHADGNRKGEPLYTAVIVPARKNVLIKGWHINNEKTDSFLVTEYAKSGAGQLKSTGNLGVISATFQAAWPEGGTPPADEPGKRRGGTGDATGFGPRVDVKFKEVKVNMGVIRDSISVRYTK